jgi:Xaa-Pro dipeptidase
MLGIIELITDGELPGSDGSWPDFPICEFARRYARLSALLEHSGLDAIIVAQPANVRYFTGFRTWLWALPPVVTIVAILTRDPGQATLVDGLGERGGMEEFTWLTDLTTYGPSDDPFDVIGKALQNRGLTDATIGLELGRGSRPHLAPVDIDRLRALAPHATWVDASPLIAAVRALKSEAEIARLREAARIAQAGFKAVYGALVPGTTEIELTRVAARAMLDEGAAPATDPSILIFMAGADRYSQPLQPATTRPIGVGELVALDGGCTADGYHSDFARAAVIGDLPPKAHHLMEVTRRALDEAVSAIRPGEPLAHAFTAAKDVFNEAGVAGAIVNPHAIGHSIGLEHWETPGLPSPTGHVDLVRARAGMVLCVEPQIAGADGDQLWRDGLFMLEDQVLVTAGGREILTADISREVFAK